MDKNELKRRLVRAAVRKGIAEIREDPERGIRKLVDLGSHFAKGRFQKAIFQLMQEQLIHEDSGYYQLTRRLIQEVQPKVLEDFGINIGYNCWTEGARCIRRHEAERGYNVPWCILMDLTQGACFDVDDLISQGEKMGIYCYFIFAGGTMQTAALFPVLRKHKDCAVFLMAGDSELPEVNMENVTNVLYLLPMHGKSTRAQAEALRTRGCCYGVWESYDEENIVRLTGGMDDDCARELGALNLFALPKPSESGRAIQNALREYVLRARDEAKFACFPVDLMEDIARVDRVISVESCMLCITGDGCALTTQKKYENLNVRSVSLEDMLMCTMPKVTYLNEKE